MKIERKACLDNLTSFAHAGAMESDTSDNFEHLYEEDDAPKHEKLINKVLSLNKVQHLKKPSRTEPTLQVSEFNLVKSITGNKGAVHLKNLTKALQKRRSHAKIGENVKKASRNSTTLPKPLEKPQAEQIRRGVAYEKTRLALDRWEAVVQSNRAASTLQFPLNSDLKLEQQKERDNFANMFRVKTKLQQELEKIQPEVEKFHIGLDEQKEFPLTMEEMRARRKELAKLRAYQGYREAKARRQNKIKSKKYHRIQKREKIKRQLKEFEELQKTNPEEALKKLEEIERTRIEERFSLRHKSTGKWAKNQQIRAKYDKDSRQVLAQQLTLSRELTQKLKTNDSESEDEPEAPLIQKECGDNPWINGVKPGKEVADFVSGYRKYWLEKNKTGEERPENGENPEKIQAEITPSIDNSAKIKKNQNRTKSDKPQSTTAWEVSTVDIEEMFDELEQKKQQKMLKNMKKLKRKITHETRDLHISDPFNKKISKKFDLSLPQQIRKPQVDDELIESSGDVVENLSNLDTLSTILSSEAKADSSHNNIDPNKFVKVQSTKLSTSIPDLLTSEENEDQRNIIIEAFEDDNIAEDFTKEKKEEINKNKAKSIDLSLPGWGSWGGSNIKMSKRKKRRFILKPPPETPRRDDNKGKLIINEKAQSKIKEHMVTEVPFPFKTVQDFEASIRAPLGNSFIPETAHRRLTQPAVTTKMGTIIQPMSKDYLLNKNK